VRTPPGALRAYPPLDRLAERFDAAVERIPGARRHTLGRSVEGRAIPACALGPARAPALLLVAGIHGNELLGPTLAVTFAEALADAATAARLYGARLWLVPVANPDGYARTWARDGRGPLAALRTNARGVDLNRNFPIPAGGRRSPWPGAGTNRIGAATYRGPRPLSEPESRALADLADSIRPVAALSLHSFMGTLIPAFSPHRADLRHYRALARAFASAQPRYRYRMLASRFFDGLTGEFEDYLHHALGCFATCVESYPVVESLRRAPPPATVGRRFLPEDPAPWIENDLPGIIAYFEAALHAHRAGIRPRQLDDMCPLPR